MIYGGCLPCHDQSNRLTPSFAMAPADLLTILAQVPGSLQTLDRTDALWHQLRNGTLPNPTIVQPSSDPIVPDLDITICGATLGVILGLALVRKGWTVCLIERGNLQGRDQEWNIARRELDTLLRLDLLTEAELTETIVTHYNPGRVAFNGGPEFWVTDVLNLGVSPKILLNSLKTKFLEAGGQLQEQTSVTALQVHPSGVEITTSNGTSNGTLRSRLVLDMMGHFSPIARQARNFATPDSVCLVTGSCAQGFRPQPGPPSGDLMVSFTPIENHHQNFWEAFPAQDGRTTYLFTYLDADPRRSSLRDLFADYLRFLPSYQQTDLSEIQFQRFLFGLLPSYKTSPLKPAWDRILQVGDSSGTQSPLSFGGFGALLRHLDRLVSGIDDALRCDDLSRSDLAALTPYQPNISVTWLFQAAMRVSLDQTLPPNQINELLSAVFQVMADSGDDVLKPFLQDVVQFPALAQTMLKTGITAPIEVLRVLPQVGLGPLLDWTRHYGALGLYAGGQAIVDRLPATANLEKFTPRQRRWLDGIRYGSGSDYHG
jgi:lycopene cyclase CruP